MLAISKEGYTSHVTLTKKAPVIRGLPKISVTNFYWITQSLHSEVYVPIFIHSSKMGVTFSSLALNKSD
jgi:hypothetical protein